MIYLNEDYGLLSEDNAVNPKTGESFSLIMPEGIKYIPLSYFGFDIFRF